MRGRGFLYSCTLTLLTCSQGILISASKGSSTTYQYSPIVANLYVELLKLLMATVGIANLRRNANKPEVETKLPVRDLFPYAVPAAIYTFKNLLQYEILRHMAAPEYQILKNLNILTTGVLCRVFLGKVLTLRDWIGLILLSIGCTISQVDFKVGSTFILHRGLLLAFLMAFSSSFAGVYTEKILKTQTHKHIHVQNLYMYSFGFGFNACFACYTHELEGMAVTLLRGFRPLVWVMIVNHACSGIAVSYVMKFAGNIAKVQATSLAMVLTTSISALLLDFQCTTNFVVGALLVVIAIYIPSVRHKS